MTTLKDAPIATDADIRSALSEETWTVDALLEDVIGPGATFRPFDERAVAFCAALSRELLAAREHAQDVALGYWLRPASIAKARESFFRAESPGILLVPRGLAFHVTPANVDTVFVYSWIVSLLAGNANIVRLSSRATDTRTRLLEAIERAIEGPANDELRRRNRLVFTGHDERISRALSSMADVRVVWGGNATVEHFRTFPLPPRGREVTFPTRHSLSILDSDAVAAVSDPEINRLADRFFNDAYWFDQGACSSPRLLLWRSSRSGTTATDGARHRFHTAVQGAIARHAYEAETGAALNKMAFALARAALADGVRIETASNEATWVTIPHLDAYDRENCGGGLFFELVSDDLGADLAALVGPEDQTATCFGIEPEVVRECARDLNGRGIDRFVSVGRALEFGSVWDGYDLLGEFSKRVLVDVQA